jgi:hypothetical protein
MGVTSHFCLWVKFPTASSCKRLIFYLDPDTRPDFPDEVPESEVEWVEVFELLPDPCSIEQIDEYTLTVYFDDESDAEPHRVCAAIALLEPDSVLSWESVEGEVYYQSWVGSDNTLLYAPQGLEDPDDDEKYNRNLNEATRKHLDELDGMPEEALRFLSEMWSN